MGYYGLIIPSVFPTGVFIQDIKQTVSSNESEGVNIMTVTLTNQQKTQFNVKNGKQGSSAEATVQMKQYATNYIDSEFTRQKNTLKQVIENGKTDVNNSASQANTLLQQKVSIASSEFKALIKTKEELFQNKVNNSISQANTLLQQKVSTASSEFTTLIKTKEELLQSKVDNSISQANTLLQQKVSTANSELTNKVNKAIDYINNELSKTKKEIVEDYFTEEFSYIKLVNGLVIQFFNVRANGTDNNTVYFPISFPNNVLTITSSLIIDTHLTEPKDASTFFIHYKTKNGFNFSSIHLSEASSGTWGTERYDIIAIGY